MPSTHDRAKRLRIIRGWLARFAEDFEAVSGVRVKYFDAIDEIDPAELIDHQYWEKLEESIRPYMKSAHGTPVVDRHKIASLYELVIADIAPIEPDGDDPEERNPLNSELAYYVAKAVIACWHARDDVDMYVSDEFDREHLSWLMVSPPSEVAVFSNAATWFLLEKYCFGESSHA